MKTTKDIKKEIMGNDNIRRLNVRLGELVNTDESTRYALVKKELDSFMSYALDHAYAEWKKGVESLEVQRLSGGGGKYDYSTNMAKWYNEGIEETIKQLHDKLEAMEGEV